MTATKLIEKMEKADLKPITVQPSKFNRKVKRANLPCVEMSNGMFLTLRERKIMKLLLDEARDRRSVFHIGNGPNTLEQQLTNAYSLLGDYIAAFKRGDINESDFERCG